MTESSLMQAEFVFHKEFEYYCFKNCYWKLLGFYGVDRPELFLDCGVEWLFAEEEETGRYGYRFSTGDFFPASSLPGEGMLISIPIQVAGKPLQRSGRSTGAS